MKLLLIQPKDYSIVWVSILHFISKDCFWGLSNFRFRSLF